MISYKNIRDDLISNKKIPTNLFLANRTEKIPDEIKPQIISPIGSKNIKPITQKELLLTKTEKVFNLYNHSINNYFKKEKTDKDGNFKGYKIDLKDLATFFICLYNPIVVNENNNNYIYIYTGNYYTSIKKDFLNSFFIKYTMKDNEQEYQMEKLKQFTQLVIALGEPKPYMDLIATTRFKINFKDCVFNVLTGKNETEKRDKYFFTSSLSYDFFSDKNNFCFENRTESFSLIDGNVSKENSSDENYTHMSLSDFYDLFSKRYNIICLDKKPVYGFGEVDEKRYYIKNNSVRYEPRLLMAWKQLLMTIIPDVLDSDWYKQESEYKRVSIEEIKEKQEDIIKQRQLLEWFIGYTLSQCETINNQYFLLMIGKGENGKSFFMEVLKKMIGVDNVSFAGIKQLIGDKFGLAICEGKIANFSDDQDSDIFSNFTSKFKEIIGGNSGIVVEKKFEQSRKANIYAKLFISTNYLPYIPEADFGFTRRMLAINFSERLTNTPREFLIRDDEVGSKKAFYFEFPYIIKHCLSVYKDNPKPNIPKSVLATMDSLKKSSDLLKKFFKDKLIPTNKWEHVISLESIFLVYKHKTSSQISYKNFCNKIQELVMETRLLVEKGENNIDCCVEKLVKNRVKIEQIIPIDKEDVFIWNNENISLMPPYSLRGNYATKYISEYVRGFLFSEQFFRLKDLGKISTIDDVFEENTMIKKEEKDYEKELIKLKKTIGDL